RNKFLKIHTSGKRRLMILGRPDAILDVTTERARSNRAHPLGMIEKRQVFLDLSMTEVMPVTNLRRVHFVEQGRQFAFGRDFFITASVFKPQFYIFGSGVIDHAT